MIWVNVSAHMPKGSRYTLGTRIENRFIDLIENTHTAYFTAKEKKAEKIAECILILDTLKFIISVGWEGKMISNRHYQEVSLKLEEIGKMFGGWRNSLTNSEKKNRTF